MAGEVRAGWLVAASFGAALAAACGGEVSSVAQRGGQDEGDGPEVSTEPPIDEGSDPERDAPVCQSLDDALEAFGACLNVDDWLASGLGKLPELSGTSAGSCGGCHSFSDQFSGDPSSVDASRKPPLLLWLVEAVMKD